jgi:hypothetical protein
LDRYSIAQIYESSLKHTLVQGSKGLQGLSGDFPVLPGRAPRHPGEEPAEGRRVGEMQELMKTIEFPFYDDPKQQIESRITHRMPSRT